MVWVVDAPCYGETVEETEQDQDENDIEDFVAFSIKGLEGFAILDGGATKTVSGFMSIQPVADQYEETTIGTTDVGCTFAGGETEAASTNICVPHAVESILLKSAVLLTVCRVEQLRRLVDVPCSRNKQVGRGSS